QGRHCSELKKDLGDFVLKRRDGIINYQLAVVVDDYLQGMTHVVRGADLLDNTERQIYLGQLLGYPRLSYMHLPLAMNDQGQKLSQHKLVPAFDLTQTPQILILTLNALHHDEIDLDTSEGTLQ